VTGPRIVALVAAHNEEPLVGRTVKALRGIEAVDDVVVVADGSTDRTADEASGAGARVLVRAARRGKGGALEACLSRIDPAEVYVLVDEVLEVWRVYLWEVDFDCLTLGVSLGAAPGAEGGVVLVEV
jgi:glycosyltransferase involved in cell wall biosynthesis